MKQPTAIIPDAIFSSIGEPQTDTALIWDGQKVLDLLPTNQLGLDFPRYNIKGWLCPGFVNSHCHLELSWLKDLIPSKTGINQFIEDLVKLQSTQQAEIIQKAIHQAIDHSANSGVAFIADIVNSGDTLFPKQSEKRILFHTFVELFGFNAVLAESKFKAGKELKEKFTDHGLSASITPHAPYSVSHQLLKLIEKEEIKELLSIHFRESQSEGDFFTSKSGEIAQRFRNMNIDFNSWDSNQTPLNYLFSALWEQKRYLWVHNTLITSDDLEFLSKNKQNHWFCLCPRANLFIENKLPPVELIYQFTNQITIGTDSLASNEDLSVWNELKTLQKGFPQIKASELIKWATANGADLFQKNDMGRLKKGYSSAIAHIQHAGIDLNKIHPDSHASLFKLV